MPKSQAWKKSRDVLRQDLTAPEGAGCQVDSC